MTIDEAVQLIQQGEVVAFPTETVYGLGADAWNPDAVQKIFDLKGRPSDNPLIVHLSGIGQISLFTDTIPEAAQRLLNSCWPGPLTLIFNKKPEVLDAVTSSLPTVALRIPDHPTALELIRRAGPIAAPSANRSGKPSPTKASHVRSDFGHTFPVLEGGKTRVGLESTVLDVTREPFTVLRPGFYSAKQLEEISGVPVVQTGEGERKPSSPGTAYSHYKPAASVRWFDPSSEPDRDQALLISHTTQLDGYLYHRHYNEDFDRLANELFDLFRTADFHNLTQIIIEPFPSDETHPLVAALRNRIEKAMN